MSLLKFWNWQLGADRMVAKYENGTLSAKRVLYCFLLIVGLCLLSNELTYLFPDEAMQLELIMVLTSFMFIVLNLVGIVYLFSKHGDRRGFIEKYFVVMVATIPVMLVYTIIFIGLDLLVQFSLPEAYFVMFGTHYFLYQLIVSLLMVMLYYAKLGTYFRTPAVNS